MMTAKRRLLRKNRGINANSTGPNYDPDAVALFDRFTTPPTDERKTLINNLIVSLKSSSVWTKLDALYIMAAADNQAARRNWVADQYNLTAVAAPTFTVDRGYAGDGASSYLATGFNPTMMGMFAQNNADMGIWCRTDLSNAGGTSFEIGNLGNSYIGRSGTTAGRADGRPNAAAGVMGQNGAFPGHAAYTRTDALIWDSYAQGIDGGGGSNASAIASQEFRICAAATNYGVNQNAAAHWGAWLSADEVLALYSAINTYLIAVGAA